MFKTHFFVCVTKSPYNLTVNMWISLDLSVESFHILAHLPTHYESNIKAKPQFHHQFAYVKDTEQGVRYANKYL